jgi:hypothetical protein
MKAVQGHNEGPRSKVAAQLSHDFGLWTVYDFGLIQRGWDDGED